jgi:hypothetical protein
MGLAVNGACVPVGGDPNPPGPTSSRRCGICSAAGPDCPRPWEERADRGRPVGGGRGVVGNAKAEQRSPAMRPHAAPPIARSSPLRRIPVHAARRRAPGGDRRAGRLEAWAGGQGEQSPPRRVEELREVALSRNPPWNKRPAARRPRASNPRARDGPGQAHPRPAAGGPQARSDVLSMACTSPSSDSQRAVVSVHTLVARPASSVVRLLLLADRPVGAATRGRDCSRPSFGVPWNLVGARGIAPRPPTFRSQCGSPSRPSRSTGCGAHDAPAVPPRRTCHRP